MTPRPLTVGPYAIVRELGAGGMGVVYLGRRLNEPGQEERFVAIKTLATGRGDPKERASFLREARIASRIRHPNVVCVVEVIEEHGQIWQVMELVSGPSVSALFRSQEAGRALALPVALRIFVDVLHGIAAAYQTTAEDGSPLAIVHRDISPQNILVGARDGVAKLVDFGIAKTATHETTTGAIGFRGKVSYVAPEQIRGARATHESDLYSACVVAWEMIAGRRLFHGETMTITITRVLLGEVPSLLSIRREVPPELDDLLRQVITRRDARVRDAATLALHVERSFPLPSRHDVAAFVSAHGEAAAPDAPAKASLDETMEAELSRTRAVPAAFAPTDVDRRPATVNAPMPSTAPTAASGAETAPKPVGRARRPIVLVGAVGALVLTAGVALRKADWRGPIGSTEAARSPTASSLSSSSSVVAGSEPASASAAEAPQAPVISAAVGAFSPTPSGTALRAAHPARRSTAVPASSTRLTHAQHPAPAESSDCRNLTYVDERGIKRVRPECVRDP
jgi:serine/threonine-protein kinase